MINYFQDYIHKLSEDKKVECAANFHNCKYKLEKYCYFEIIKIDYIWQSGKSWSSNFFYRVDKFLNIFSSVYPNLFARSVIMLGKNKKP